MLSVFFIIFILILILMILLVVLKNSEYFFQEIGGGNDWGGAPQEETSPQTLIQCNIELDALNNSYNTYLETRDKLIKNSEALRENFLKNLDLDSIERVNMYKGQIKDYTKGRDKALAEYATEKKAYNICVQQTTPLNAILNTLRTCCDTSRNKADMLTKQYNSCVESGPQIIAQIITAENRYNDMVNQINNLKNTNNQLNKNLNDCISKKQNYQQILNGCMR